MPPKNSTSKDSVVVNFRISAALYKLLEEHAKGQQDEAGQELSPGMAARRIVVDLLKNGKNGKEPITK